MKGPNFFLAGAAKSGTTTLYEALRAHPEVYLPAVKESHVYAYLADPSTADHLYTDEADARRHQREQYRDVAGEMAVGDCSATTLAVPGTAALIDREVPGARVVVLLRQPIDRAFSHFCHFVTAGGETTRDFAEAVRAEPARQAEGYPFTYRYLGWSRYSRLLRPFLDGMGPERVLVHLYDDLCADPESVLRATLGFLGVDDRAPLPPVGRHNVVRAAAPPPPPGRAPGLARLRRLVARPRPEPPTRPTLDPGLRAELTASFDEEIRSLEDLLGRDLAAWRA